jgi:hypothetical protein
MYGVFTFFVIWVLVFCLISAVRRLCGQSEMRDKWMKAFPPKDEGE